MNSKKNIDKLRYYLLNDSNFRFEFFNRSSIYPNYLFIQEPSEKYADIDNPRVPDFFWSWGIGFFSPEREREFTARKKPWSEFFIGKNDGCSGGIWKILRWTVRFLQKNGRQFYSLPFRSEWDNLDRKNNWNLDRSVIDAFHVGLFQADHVSSASWQEKFAWVLATDLRKIDSYDAVLERVMEFEGK